MGYAEEEPIEVRRVGHALDLVALLRRTHELWYGPREVWGFRGQGDSTWQLVPSAFREGWETWLPANMVSPSEKPEDAQNQNEWHAYLHFYRLANETGHYVPGGEHVTTLMTEEKIKTQLTGGAWPFDLLIEGLAIAQHHGVPTRLLDFTHDGLVAAYFAATSAIALREGARTPDFFSIWAVNCGFLNHAWGDWLNQRFRIVQVPLARNAYLLAQHGFFIYDSSAYANWPPPSLNEAMQERSRDPEAWKRIADRGPLEQWMLPPVIYRFDVPNSEAEQLLLELYQFERVSRAHLMPTMDNVVQTLQYMKALQSRISDE